MASSREIRAQIHAALSSNRGPDADGGALAAEAFCNALRSSPDGWRELMRMCAEETPDAMVSFWTLEVLTDQVRLRWAHFSAEDKDAVRRFALAGREAQKPCMYPYIEPIYLIGHGIVVRNKQASLLAALMWADYPLAWPSLVRDVLGLASQSQDAFSLALRFLLALHEDVLVQAQGSQDRAVLQRVMTIVRSCLYGM